MFTLYHCRNLTITWWLKDSSKIQLTQIQIAHSIYTLTINHKTSCTEQRVITKHKAYREKQVQVQLITKPREGNTGYTKTHEYS